MFFSLVCRTIRRPVSTLRRWIDLIADFGACSRDSLIFDQKETDIHPRIRANRGACSNPGPETISGNSLTVVYCTNPRSISKLYNGVFPAALPQFPQSGQHNNGRT